jgi:hypothetical protein
MSAKNVAVQERKTVKTIVAVVMKTVRNKTKMSY